MSVIWKRLIYKKINKSHPIVSKGWLLLYFLLINYLQITAGVQLIWKQEREA